MSLVGMRKYMHNKMRIVMLVLTFFMGVGIVAYFGLGSLNSPNGTKGQTVNNSGSMAKVGGESLDRQEFNSRYEMSLPQMVQQTGRQIPANSNTTQLEQLIGPISTGMARNQVFQQCIDLMVVVQAAKNEGIKIGDVNREIDNQVDKSIKSMFAAVTQGKPTSDSTAWQMLLPRLVAMGKAKSGMSMDMYREQLRNSISPNLIEQQMYAQQLQNKIKSGIKDVSDKALKASYDSVTFRRLTIDSKRPDAQKTANDLAEKLKGGADFASLAKKNSDDPMKSQGGLVANMPVSYLQSQVSNEISKMKIGEVAGPFNMDKSLVILKLEKKENLLPPDFNKPDKQKEYRANYLQMASSRAENDLITKYKKSIKIEVIDPEMKAFQVATDNQSRDSGALLKVVDAFKSAAGQSGVSDPQSMARCYTQVALGYAQLSNPAISPKKEDQTKYKAEEKAALLKALQNIEHPDLRLMLAQLRIEDKEYKEAADDLGFVSDNSYSDPGPHAELLRLYKQMEAAGYAKASTLVAAEVKWQADYDKQQKERAAAMQAQQAAQEAAMKAQAAQDAKAKSKPAKPVTPKP